MNTVLAWEQVGAPEGAERHGDPPRSWLAPNVQCQKPFGRTSQCL